MGARSRSCSPVAVWPLGPRKGCPARSGGLRSVIATAPQAAVLKPPGVASAAGVFLCLLGSGLSLRAWLLPSCPAQALYFCWWDHEYALPNALRAHLAVTDAVVQRRD